MEQGWAINRGAMTSQALAEIAQRHHCSLSQVIFRFALSVGMLPLTGSSDGQHMKSDLEVFDIHLAPSEIDCIERIAG